jgi:preprotein translocase SecE subunit
LIGFLIVRDQGVSVAESKPNSKKRQLKRTETVRERATKAQAPKKPRRITRARSAVWTPFRIAGRFIARILTPFAFVLRPFKTRPMRFIGRILATVLLLRYFRNSWRELRQVEWPDRKQTAKLTFAVFLFAIFFGVMISLADYGLDKLFKQVILK